MLFRSHAVGTNSTTGKVQIIAADAAIPSTMPAMGVLDTTLAVNGEGIVIFNGELKNVNTAGFAAGDEVWVKEGGWGTNVKPTGAANSIQKIAQILKADEVGDTGTALIFGAGRSNDIPNIPENCAWVGDENDVPQPVPVYTQAEVDTLISSAGSGGVGSFTLIFQHEGGTEDKWLGHHGHNGISSHKSPAVIPWDCTLVGMTFTNKKDNGDSDIEIYVAPAGAGKADALEYTMTIRNERIKSITNFVDPPTFNTGDKVAVYARALVPLEDKIEHVVVTLYLSVTSNINTDISETWSGDF